jgi:hypothetical protein
LENAVGSQLEENSYGVRGMTSDIPSVTPQVYLEERDRHNHERKDETLDH